MAWIGCLHIELELISRGKVISFADDFVVESVIVRVRRPISIRTIFTMKLKWCARRGC